MLSNEFHLKLKDVVKICSESEKEQNNHESNGDLPKLAKNGGFLSNGSLVWRSKGSILDIFCTTTGDKKLFYNFEYDLRTQNCTIITVQEMFVGGPISCIIVVGVQLENDMGMIIVLTLQGSRVLGYIDINDHMSCMQTFCKGSYYKGRISQYDGCIAVGTMSGKILLIDTCMKQENDHVFGQRLVMNSLNRSQCHVEFASGDQEQFTAQHTIVRRRGIYFGLQLEPIDEKNNPVSTILDLPPLMAFAAGYADGRIVLYDLLDLNVIHIAQSTHKNSRIVSMSMIEPTDDPKACVYLWAFHASKEDGAFAVMHTLMYEEKYAESNGHVYEHFLSCSPRLNITCYDKNSYPLGIQSIMKTVSQEEEVLTLSILTWIASDKSTNVLVFDLNQWYKAEMPFRCDWRHELNHTVVFNIKEIATSVQLVADSLIPFNSIQRPEEHFYPNSLSFDIRTLRYGNCPRYHWIGLQNKILDYFEQNGIVCLMEPSRIYNIMLRSALIPQFTDYNFTSDVPQEIQREFLLSVALEYNCSALLHECAISWADGSHLGKDPDEGVSLSTLTEWMWNRAKMLKELSNGMCIPLFDLSGRRIDCGTQKTLLHCSRQLTQLTKLYELIFSQCKQYIPDKVLKCLASQKKSVQLASDYQEVVQWLLNVGLLPEGNIDGINLSDEFLLVPFPYQAIRSYYSSQRMEFYEHCSDKENATAMEDQHCKYLFIDNFVEREFPAESLRSTWIENSASGVYPPNSMQNLLRALLIPNVSIEIKYILLCYTFMDMTAVLGEGRYGDIVQNLIKFPAVFKLNSATIKRTQAFWLLDHGNINGAIEELLSPMSQSERFPLWQREFLISTLLRNDAPHLALRAVRSPGTPISPFLELKTLLENNLISEAFKLQRSKHDTNLLCSFFEGTLQSTKYEVLLDLALSEDETRILREYLTRTNQPMAENVHFIHLLQKIDFVEAVCMVDKLGKKRSNDYNLEAPKETLALYHSALEPTTQHLSYLAYAEQKYLKPSKAVFAETLSSRLIRGRADFRGRIYHKSIVTIREAAEPLDHAQPFLEKPGLGIFQLRRQTKSSNVCYPVNVEVKVAKRKYDDVNLPDTSEKLNCKMFLDFEHPAKRRKIETDVPFSTSLVFPKTVLTEFRPAKASFNFSSKHSNGSSREKSFSRSPSTQLSTPVVKKMLSCYPPSPESVSSYTPHGILKSTASVQSFLNQRCASPASASVAPSSHANEIEEKILRFDIPNSPTIRKKSQEFMSSLKTPTQNDSMLSNDVFFSPEGSTVSMEDNAQDLDIKDILYSPKARPPIHSHSRSITPESNNIAIIIEDVEDEMSSKQQENQITHDEPQCVLEPIERTTLVNLLADDNESLFQESARELLDVTDDADVSGIKKDIFSSEHLGKNYSSKAIVDSVTLQYSSTEADSCLAPIVIVDNEETPTKTMELKQQTCFEGFVENDEHDEDVQDQAEIVVTTVETNQDETCKTSADAEVINISCSSSSNDDDSQGEDDNSDDDMDVLNPIGKPFDKKSDNLSKQRKGSRIDMFSKESMQYEDMENAGHNTESNRNISDFYSDTVPDVILDQMENDTHTDGSNEAQVSTTTSTNSNIDSTDTSLNVEVHQIEAVSGHSSGNTRHHEAEDLTVQLEEMPQTDNRARTPEPSTSRARNLTVSMNDRSDSSMNADISIVSPSRDESFSLKKDDKFLGQPKKAHEVEIPAMNLSVKPDEAHEANRKNSKSDESDDAAALNLSTGQIVGVMQTEEQVSDIEIAEEKSNSPAKNNFKNVTTSNDDNRQKSQTKYEESQNESAEHSSDAIPKKISKKNMNDAIDTLVTPRRLRRISTDSAEASTSTSKSNVKTRRMSATGMLITPRRSRRISTDSAEASTSTPKSNPRTRRMSTIENIEECGSASSKRKTRASSVATENSTPNTSLGRSRKHSSMTNIATPESVILTPRRSKRASSLATEILTGTPLSRKRHSSETKIETTATDNINVSSKEVNINMADKTGSEKSFTSSNRRSGRRYSAAIHKQTLQPSLSAEPVEACLIKPSGSSSIVEKESFAEYSTTRRLTRHQSAIMEKSLHVVRNMCTIPEDSDNPIPHEDHESEAESAVSNISNTSKRSTRSTISQKSRTKSQTGRSTRTRALYSTRPSTSKQDNSETESYETDHSESPSKKSILETISEEDDQTITKSRRRGRSRKM